MTDKEKLMDMFKEIGVEHEEFGSVVEIKDYEGNDGVGFLFDERGKFKEVW